MQPITPVKTPASRWPEPLRDSPRPADPFPVRLFLIWLLPGLIGLIVLIGLYAFLEQRAAKQILYLTANGSIGAIRVDGGEPRQITLPGTNAQLLGAPQWSPRGGRFAGVMTDSKGPVLLIADSKGATQQQIPLTTGFYPTLAGAAWSSGGRYVVVTDSGESQYGGVELVDIEQSRTITSPLTLDLTSTIQWHPQRDELLVTAVRSGDSSELQVFTPDGQSRAFAPDDKQHSRRDGSWSPDGSRIAYVATATLTATVQTLWVANADGSNPQAIVSEGMNYQPIWAPRGDLILFTRLKPGTQEYLLYRVQPDGQNLQPIGRGLAPELLGVVDRHNVIDWSPDQNWMFFQSYNPQNSTISLSLAAYDGSNAQSIVTESKTSRLAAHWSPTSRGVLLASSEGGLRLRWIDRETPQKFTNGFTAAWEP